MYFSVSVDNLPPKSIKMNMVAQLETFSVRLCDSENNFALIDVKGWCHSPGYDSTQLFQKYKLF